MLRVTGPVTRSRSACRGEATKCTPKRSLSYTGLVSPTISSSQPLQEPASTSRIASARPNRRRARASTSCRRRTTSSPPGGRGSVARPTWRILEKSRTSAPAGFAAQLLEHGLRADEMVVEDAAGDVEQVPDGSVADGVAHAGALLAGLDDVLGPQHRELLGHGGLVETEGLLELVHGPAAPDEDLEDPDADRVGESLEELRLEDLELPAASGLLHANYLIYVYIGFCQEDGGAGSRPRTGLRAGRLGQAPTRAITASANSAVPRVPPRSRVLPPSARAWL